MQAAAHWQDAMAAGSIVLSAGTYLFGFGSNMVVLVQYSRMRWAAHLQMLKGEEKGISSCVDALCRRVSLQLSIFSYSLLALFAFGHLLNALLFKLKFTRNKAPLCAAYCLPLIHLYRLLHLLWRTISCKGIQDITSPEMTGLYCILGSAMEGVPMLNLQFTAYLVLSLYHISVRSMSTTFKVSAAASLISVAYNGGTSVESIAKNATTLKQKLCAGVVGASFTLSATVLRCSTLTNLNVYIQLYWFKQRTQHEQAKFHGSDFIALFIMAGSFVAYCLYFWFLHLHRAFARNLPNPHRLAAVLVFSCLSVQLSPLYPLISQANDANQLGSYVFRQKLLTVSLLHILLDLAVLRVTHLLGTLPKPHLIVSSLAAGGYIFFLIAYMKFDASCGPPMRSSVLVEPTAQDVHDGGNDHRVISLSDLCMLTITIYPQEIEKLEVDAVSQHVNPSSQNTHLALCEKAEAMHCPLEGEKHIRAHTHNASLAGTIKDRQSLLAFSLSLDRAMNIAIKRDRPCMAAWSSLDRYSRAYSEWKETRGPNILRVQ